MHGSSERRIVVGCLHELSFYCSLNDPGNYNLGGKKIDMHLDAYRKCFLGIVRELLSVEDLSEITDRRSSLRRPHLKITSEVLDVRECPVIFRALYLLR